MTTPADPGLEPSRSTRPLGARTTAEQALRGVSSSGRQAIVTGGNTGLGEETVRVLALAGADVVLACRSREAGERTAARLRESLPGSAGTIDVADLDLTDFASVRAFAAAFGASGRPLHLLVNNAGVMATPLARTRQNIELQLGTNHVGHFLLTALLTETLIRSAPARIVTVSSALHRKGDAARLLQTLEQDPSHAQHDYTPFGAYGDSKLANVLFTHELARRLPAGVEAFALHPGVIPTQLTRNLGVGGAIWRTVGKPFLKSIAQGAATSVYAATAPELSGKSGAYLSDCRLATASAAARDPALAERVWRASERLIAAAER